MFKLTYDDQFCLASFNLGFWGEGGGVDFEPSSQSQTVNSIC